MMNTTSIYFEMFLLLEVNRDKMSKTVCKYLLTSFQGLSEFMIDHLS